MTGIYDTLIVGGGPAGGSAAFFLGQAGQRVLVLEKENLPRYKPCGGGLSEDVLNQFPFSFEPVIERRVKAVRYVLDDQAVTIPLPGDSMCMVMRDRFDAYLLQHARAELRPGIEGQARAGRTAGSGHRRDGKTVKNSSLQNPDRRGRRQLDRRPLRGAAAPPHPGRRHRAGSACPAGDPGRICRNAHARLWQGGSRLCLGLSEIRPPVHRGRKHTPQTGRAAGHPQADNCPLRDNPGRCRHPWSPYPHFSALGAAYDRPDHPGWGCRRPGGPFHRRRHPLCDQQRPPGSRGDPEWAAPPPIRA